MIQLRIRTEYNFGETYVPSGRCIQRLKEIGCKAAAIVDKSSWGHVRWFNECKKAGIEPMLGMEIVVTDEDGDCPTPAMWFIAKNQDGLSELYEFASKSHSQKIQGRRKTARLFKDDILSMSDNIFKFCGDVVEDKFVEQCRPIIDLNPSSRILNAKKTALAKKFGLSTINTSDNAFCYEEDDAIFELIGGSMKPTPQFILEGVGNEEAAQEIASACAGLVLPSAPMVRVDGDLEALCREGIEFRKMSERWTEEYESRLNYELELIRSKDFESYFLIVADMTKYAKQHMLVGPSRGSAAGSLVCYLSRITEIDPIPPKLYFERFIDVSRTDLPDIDLDFPDDKRGMVFEYMAAKYGFKNTAHIGTINQLKPKSALIQVCKALGIPPIATAGVKAAIIERSSADSRANNCLEDTLKTTEPGKKLLEMYPSVELATRLEGHASHTGVHAAGLLVCNEPITKFCVVDEDGIAHIEKGAAESLGLLKIDVLGLRTLGILEDSGVDVDWYNLQFDDAATYEIFNNQRLCGIFQFEGNALRSISKEMEFKSLVEIDAVTALARPGPFGGGVTDQYVKRSKGQPYEPIHPLVEQHMQETYGLPVYQEQTLAIVREIGKFDWKETSTIRKAMSKRMGKEFFDTYWEKFKVGAESQGVDEEAARKTWETINAMGAWQMNKCAAEGTLVRITANNAGVPIWCPIERLYEKYIENPSPWIKQQRSMPRLLSLFPDGKGKPQIAFNIHKNGEKECVELVFDDGSKTRCTPDHKFLINGDWRPCGDASIGDEFLCLKRESHGGKPTGLPVGKKTGRKVAIRDFKGGKTNAPCEDCGQVKSRMEVHHNDHNHGLIRMDDLSWLCSSCHKTRHKMAGDWDTPFDAGHIQFSKRLVSSSPVGKLMTYDIEMPEHHNYVVDGGLVTHNSHTFSYAVISYWTAYLKAHFPLEFAAANLRNAKSEDSAVELLREMVKEGVQYVPFDLQLSEVNWCVKNGILYGGFTSLKGIGEASAAKFVEARNAGRLTQKDIDKINACENLFDDIFPFSSKYKQIYENPSEAGVGGRVFTIEEIVSDENIPHGEERVFMGEVIYKNSRDANEDVNVKKRGGEILKGQTQFADMRLRDDTGAIGCRIGRWDWNGFKHGGNGGKWFIENVPEGAHMLVRAKFFNNIRFGFITKFKVME